MKITYLETKIQDFCLHRIGNKVADEGFKLSSSTISIEKELKNLLIHYFVSPFKSEKYYNLSHSTDLGLNEVYNYVSKIFENPHNLYDQSVNLAKHLYDQSTHPNIKEGEFYVVYFKDCLIDGGTVDAVGLFKSENKDTFLKVYPKGDGFEIESEKGININKLDKGALIFNVFKEKGYLVSIVDNTNKGADAKYWTNNFLNVFPFKDNYYQTQNLLSLCKDFVYRELPKKFEVNKADQAILINKSLNALKKDSVNINEFAQEVFDKPEFEEKFKQYKSVYQKERDTLIENDFKTSSEALKRKGIGSLTTIKLDKNFDINIHGGEKFIEQGYDDKRKMFFYKLFFKEEK